MVVYMWMLLLSFPMCSRIASSRPNTSRRYCGAAIAACSLAYTLPSECSSGSSIEANGESMLAGHRRRQRPGPLVDVSPCCHYCEGSLSRNAWPGHRRRRRRVAVLRRSAKCSHRAEHFHVCVGAQQWRTVGCSSARLRVRRATAHCRACRSTAAIALQSQATSVLELTTGRWPRRVHGPPSIAGVPLSPAAARRRATRWTSSGCDIFVLDAHAGRGVHSQLACQEANFITGIVLSSAFRWVNVRLSYLP